MTKWLGHSGLMPTFEKVTQKCDPNVWFETTGLVVFRHCASELRDL